MGKADKTETANDVDRHHGLHTQECFDYARKTMKDTGIAHCIVQCADARSARLTAGASKVPCVATGGIDKARERALDVLTSFDIPGARALEVLNIFEGAVVDELATLERQVTEPPRSCVDTTKCFDFEMIRAWLSEIMNPFQGVPSCTEEHRAAARALREYLDEALGRTFVLSCLAGESRLHNASEAKPGSAGESRPRNASEAKPGRVYRVVETDNFGGDYPNESFEGPLMTYEECERVAETFNMATHADHGGSRYYKTEHRSYKLAPGFEP